MDSVGGQVTSTLNTPRFTSHLRPLQFFSECLILSGADNAMGARLVLRLFEALLLSVGISRELNCYKSSQQGKERQNWSGDCCPRTRQDYIKGSPPHLRVLKEPLGRSGVLLPMPRGWLMASCP